MIIVATLTLCDEVSHHTQLNILVFQIICKKSLLLKQRLCSELQSNEWMNHIPFVYTATMNRTKHDTTHMWIKNSCWMHAQKYVKLNCFTQTSLLRLFYLASVIISWLVRRPWHMLCIISRKSSNDNEPYANNSWIRCPATIRLTFSITAEMLDLGNCRQQIYKTLSNEVSV